MRPEINTTLHASGEVWASRWHFCFLVMHRSDLYTFGPLYINSSGLATGVVKYDNSID